MKRKICFFAFLLLVSVILSSCMTEIGVEEGMLGIYVLDVGQGDSILLRTESGDILIDAGPDDAQTQLCLRLRALGVKSLLLAVFSHADEDHAGGGDGVLSEFPAKEVWLSETETESDCMSRLLDVCQKQQIPIRCVNAGEVMRLGDLTLSVLHPFSNLSSDTNERSIVLKLVHKNIAALFTGDVGKDAEEAILERYGASQLRCDLYKVGHHGSYSSSSAQFLKAMSPSFAVISCAEGNPYGHPHGEVLERIEEAGATIYRTDLSGEIVFYSDGERLIPPPSKQ